MVTIVLYILPQFHQFGINLNLKIVFLKKERKKYPWGIVLSFNLLVRQRVLLGKEEGILDLGDGGVGSDPGGVSREEIYIAVGQQDEES